MTGAATDIAMCVFVTDRDGLGRLDEPYAPDPRPACLYVNWLNRARERFAATAPGAGWSRLYFGQEFCQRLLPGVETLRAAIEQAQRRSWGFSLVTPYVTDDGLVRLEPLLDALAGDWPGAEVVCNDWGVLATVGDRYPDLSPVAGRMLDKMKRDPRFSSADYARFFSEQGLNMLRDSNANAPAYQELLRSYRVGRIEFDNVLQGNDVDLSGSGMAGSVYAPFGLVTTGRVCFIGSLGLSSERRFRVGAQCRRECRDYEHFLRRNLSPMPGAVASDSVQQVELARKGNTTFYSHGDVSWVTAKRGFDRLVYEPVVPI